MRYLFTQKTKSKYNIAVVVEKPDKKSKKGNYCNQ